MVRAVERRKEYLFLCPSTRQTDEKLPVGEESLAERETIGNLFEGIVSFPEGEGGNQIVEEIFRGPIQEQLRSALRYIRNMYITEKVIKHPDRAEADRFFNYPYVAIEEAGYRVFNRRYRNRRIGEFLKELHLTEGRNTGFGKILKALSNNGSPAPLFETDDERSYFATTLFIHEGFKESLKNKDVTQDVTQDVTDPIDARIMAMITADSKITTEEIADELGISTRTVKRRIKAMPNIQYVGSGFSGHWEISG